MHANAIAQFFRFGKLDNVGQFKKLPTMKNGGLYACLFGGLSFWMFCGSRHTAVTVTSAAHVIESF